MVRIFIFFFILELPFQFLKAQGIIIANEKKQTEVFSDSIMTNLLIEDIKKKYTKVIIHLGQGQVFAQGNIFASETNKKNLVCFCNSLESSNIPVFLWFFDSFSGKAFLQLYNSYKVMADDNISVIQSLDMKYTGLVTDMEWINLPDGNNNEKFREIMMYLKSKLPEKKIFYFTSLINSEAENSSRGYDITRLKADNIHPISMLYLKDGGFKVHKNKIVPYLHNARVKELRKYLKKNKIDVAVSFEGAGIVLKGTIPKVVFTFFGKNDTIAGNLTEFKRYTKKNYEMIVYETGDKIGIDSIDSKVQELWMFKVLPQILNKDDYVWEYFRLMQN